MVTFNVFGNCVSRDVFNLLTGQARVLQYSGFVNPISMFSSKGDFEMKAEDLKEFKGPNFYKRILCQDVNKTSFEYITESKADYIVIDLLGVRFNMLRKNNHYITCASPYLFNKKTLERDYKLDTYEIVKFSDISENEWIESLEKFCKLVLKHYPPSKIILFEYFGAEDYLENGAIKKFSQYNINTVRNYNSLVKKLNEYAKEKFLGCHILHFPDNVCADKSNIRGLHSLHYNSLYYEYGARAIQTIVKNLPENEEVEILEDLRQVCSDRFELLRKRAELKSKSFTLAATQNVFDFTKALCSDRYENDNFYKNIEKLKANNQKVAILKSSDVSGQILLKALEKCKAEVIFTTATSDLKRLSDEDFEKCRQADVIISASVHSNVTTERDGVKAVLIKDLLG